MAEDESEAEMGMEKKRVAKKKKRGPVWELRLYIANATARSTLATENLQSLCEKYLHGLYRLTIIDLMKRPELARADEILATPTLVRVRPEPQRTVIGSLSDPQNVLKALEMGVPPEKLVSLVSHVGSPIASA
jgi:circadian clock protein KaiB